MLSQPAGGIPRRSLSIWTDAVLGPSRHFLDDSKSGIVAGNLAPVGAGIFSGGGWGHGREHGAELASEGRRTLSSFLDVECPVRGSPQGRGAAENPFRCLAFRGKTLARVLRSGGGVEAGRVVRQSDPEVVNENE